MSFWAGFLDQYNKIEDRKQRERLLKDQLAEKRRDQLLSLSTSRSKRTSVAKNEVGAYEALASRIPNTPDGKKYLENVRNLGVASQVMDKINSTEDQFRKDGVNVKLQGDTILESFIPYGEPGGQPTVDVLTPQEILSVDKEFLLNDENYGTAFTGLNVAPRGEGFVDVDRTKVSGATIKLQGTAKDRYLDLLQAEFSKGGRASDATTQSLINSLSSDNKATANAAFLKLSATPEGIMVYDYMISNADKNPEYAAVADMHEFKSTRQAWAAYTHWDRLTPENQEKALKMYPWLNGLVGQ